MENKILQYHSFYDYSEVEIQYGIKTKKISLDILSELLDISPTRGFSFREVYKGKQLNTGTREIEIVDRKRPCTLWVLNTNSLTESNRFENHAEQLLNKLFPKQNIIKSLIDQKEDFEINTLIYLTFDPAEKYFGFGTTSEYFKKLSDISHWIEWRTK
jgi:hypothetical protein